MSQDKLRLLCGGTQKSDGGELKGNRSLEWEVSDVLWNTEQTPPALGRMVQTNERNLAANNRLKGHPPATIQRIVHWAERRKMVSAHVSLLCEQFRTYSIHTGSISSCFCFIKGFSKTILIFSVLWISRFVLGRAAVKSGTKSPSLRRNCLSSYPRTHRSSEY
jgi:hypothetical protein